MYSGMLNDKCVRKWYNETGLHCRYNIYVVPFYLVRYLWLAFSGALFLCALIQFSRNFV